MTRPADPSVHVRAVRRSDHPERWPAVVDALGGSPRPGGPGEQVFALGAGCLVVRPTAGENPVTALELGSASSGDPVTGARGTAIARRIVASPPDPSGEVSVCPLWMTADVSVAAAALRSAGLAVRLASDAGQWVDLLAPGGGLVAVHTDIPPEPDVAAHPVLAFETGDVDALARRFQQRGLRADVVDESYGRSLRIDDPDGGVELWVNETMTDLYGYRRGPA